MFAARCRPWCIHSWHQATQPTHNQHLDFTPCQAQLQSTAQRHLNLLLWGSLCSTPVHGPPWAGEKQMCGRQGSWKKTHLTSSGRSCLLLATTTPWHWCLLSICVQLGFNQEVSEQPSVMPQGYKFLGAEEGTDPDLPQPGGDL